MPWAAGGRASREILSPNRFPKFNSSLGNLLDR